MDGLAMGTVATCGGDEGAGVGVQGGLGDYSFGFFGIVYPLTYLF